MTLNSLNLKAAKFSLKTNDELYKAKWYAQQYTKTLSNILDISGKELKKNAYISFTQEYDVKNANEGYKARVAVEEVKNKIIQWNNKQENPVDIRDITFNVGIQGKVYQKNFFFFKYNFMKWTAVASALLTIKPNAEHPATTHQHNFLKVKGQVN
jgi:hypothetical protein